MRSIGRYREVGVEPERMSLLTCKHNSPSPEQLSARTMHSRAKEGIARDILSAAVNLQ